MGRKFSSKILDIDFNGVSTFKLKKNTRKKLIYGNKNDYCKVKGTDKLNLFLYIYKNVIHSTFETRNSFPKLI